MSQIKDGAAWERVKQEFAEEGRQQEKQEIVRAMLECGVEVPFIAEVTGLPPEEIEQFRTEGK